MTVSFKETSNIYQKPNNSTKLDKNLPIKIAALSALGWMGVGLGTDYLILNKCFKIKTSKKESLFINGILGLCAGIYTYLRTKKMQKNENVKNIDDFIQHNLGKK